MQSSTKTKIVGVDEVGRGCGAGPLMACAFVFLKPCEDIGLKDSKELTPKTRQEIFQTLSALRKEGSLDWSLVSVSAKTIDQEGLQNCNVGAVRLAAKLLVQQRTDMSLEIIVDGNMKLNPIALHNKLFSFRSVVKADKLYPSVSAASIVAKVSRDHYIEKLGEKFPEYLWDKNKGYLTKAHCEAIKKHGISPYHRKSFCNSLDGG